jgi:uncharacterized protein
MVKQVRVSFKNHKGLTLRGVVHVPKRYDTAFVFLHGFPGSMSGSSKRACTALAKKGWLCLRFDFSGSASSDGAFEHKLMSDEVKDTRAAIDFLAANYSYKKLILLGHSTGAIDAALYAHTDKRITGLVLAGTVAKLDEAAHYDFSDRQVREFWTKGYTHTRYKEPWMKKGGKLFKAFYDEFFTLDLPKAIRAYRRPLLVIHGSKDNLVPLSEAKAMHAQARSPKKFVVVQGGDHSFKPRVSAFVSAVYSFGQRL